MPGLLQLRIACLPGGSVSRKHPQLQHQVSFHLYRQVHVVDGCNIPWSLAGRAHNRNALRHHDLIPHVRVQVPTRHEARLARMCVYPPQHHQLFLVAVVEQVALVCHLARIARARLRGDDKPRDEQRVVFQYAAQDTTRLEVEPRVPFGGGEEVLAQGGGEEDGAEWIAVLQVGGGLEGELV